MAAFNSNTTDTARITCAFWFHNGHCTVNPCRYAHYLQEGFPIASLPRYDPVTGRRIAGTNVFIARIRDQEAREAAEQVDLNALAAARWREQRRAQEEARREERRVQLLQLRYRTEWQRRQEDDFGVPAAGITSDRTWGVLAGRIYADDFRRTARTTSRFFPAAAAAPVAAPAAPPSPSSSSPSSDSSPGPSSVGLSSAGVTPQTTPPTRVSSWGSSPTSSVMDEAEEHVRENPGAYFYGLCGDVMERRARMERMVDQLVEDDEE